MDRNRREMICLEVTLTRLYQKTKQTRNGWILDVYRTKQIQTEVISPVWSTTGFVRVKQFLTYLPNINRHGSDL